MTATAADARRALAEVLDPEYPVSLVDLGLVGLVGERLAVDVVGVELGRVVVADLVLEVLLVHGISSHWSEASTAS